VVADEKGNVRGVGRAGPGNPNAAGSDGATAALKTSFDAALRQAKAGKTDVAGVFVGMAGIVGADDLALGRRLLTAAGIDHPVERVGLDHDIRISLAGGLTGAPGIALIVGTGSSCYGRAADGRTHQAGGWGSVLDDGGSAFGLGHAAMCAAVRVADGRLPDSRVLADVMRVLGLHEIRQIVDKVYRTGITKAEVASLAPSVIEAWRAGDRVATDIVKAQVEELAWIVETASRKLDMPAPRVAYNGGLIENSPEYARAAITAIEARAAGARVSAPQLPPILGAVLLAYEQVGQAHDVRTWEALTASLAAVS
jgi:N-acetylglucosamine kinase-like BadF-type ATPase